MEEFTGQYNGYGKDVRNMHTRVQLGAGDNYCNRNALYGKNSSEYCTREKTNSMLGIGPIQQKTKTIPSISHEIQRPARKFETDRDNYPKSHKMLGSCSESDCACTQIPNPHQHMRGAGFHRHKRNFDCLYSRGINGVVDVRGRRSYTPIYIQNEDKFKSASFTIDGYEEAFHKNHNIQKRGENARRQDELQKRYSHKEVSEAMHSLKCTNKEDVKGGLGVASNPSPKKDANSPNEKVGKLPYQQNDLGNLPVSNSKIEEKDFDSSSESLREKTDTAIMSRKDSKSHASSLLRNDASCSTTCSRSLEHLKSLQNSKVTAISTIDDQVNKLRKNFDTDLNITRTNSKHSCNNGSQLAPSNSREFSSNIFNSEIITNLFNECRRFHLENILHEVERITCLNDMPEKLKKNLNTN